MANTLVSIIIPIYNVSEYLDTCVQSACDQTYRNLEIILVDDGSPDDCPQKCDAWASKDPRIRVIHKKNGGLSDARNAGLDAAHGQYVYFLDSDDYIAPELVETAAAHMRDNVDMVAFRFHMVFPDGTMNDGYYHELGTYDLEDTAKRTDFIVQTLLMAKIGWEAWNRMYSRELIERYQLRFADNRVIFAEDQYFCLCYCAHARKVRSIDKRLYFYRQRDDSIMGQNKSKLNAGRLNELAKSALAHFQKWDDCRRLVRIFPVIHHMIFRSVMDQLIWERDLPSAERRREFLDDIGDLRFYRKQTRKLPLFCKQLHWNFSGGLLLERVGYALYLAYGHDALFGYFLRIMYRYWHRLERHRQQQSRLKSRYKKLQKFRKRVFLLATDEYGNIGDHKINESVVSFLHHTLPEHLIHEVTARDWPDHKQFLINCIRPNDLIVFPGGGNFGDTYLIAPNLRAEIIRLWPDNPKIIFPQTIHFSDSPKGKEMLEEAKLIYTRENHITLFARERPSYEFAQEHFSCNSYLIPDIVLSSDAVPGTNRENMILLCMRQDQEKTVTGEMLAQIRELCDGTNMVLEETDLQLDYHIDRKDRKAAIDEKFALWRRSRLVITDRLHAMIFAAITETPCIAFSNFNHKIRGTYEWIRYLPYIRYAESVEDFRKHLPELLEMNICQFNNAPLKPCFDKLAEVLRNCSTTGIS